MFQTCINNKLLLSLITVFFSAAQVWATPESSFDQTSDWAVTQRKFKTIQYTWTITNYSTYVVNSFIHLESSIFPADDENKWQVHYYFKDLYNSGDPNYISLFLLPLTQDNIYVKYKFALRSMTNEEIVPKVTNGIAFRNNFLGHSPYIHKNTLANSKATILPNDTLTIIVEIETPTEFETISGHCHFTKFNASHSDNFLSLLENELFSDMKIVIGKHEFSVHRAILASVSPVFLALFKETRNLSNQSISIPDVDPQVFRELLRFIYTGKVQNIEKVGEDLLPLAEKYAVKQLKALCEEALCKRLSSSNAIDYLLLAENNAAENLQLQASNFIAAHAKDVMRAPSYVGAVANNLHPLLRVFRESIENYSTPPAH